MSVCIWVSVCVCARLSKLRQCVGLCVWCVYMSPCLCVCVSSPWCRRGQHGIHSSAANDDSCGHSVKQIGTTICVPARKLLITLSNSLLLFPWWFMILPQTIFPPPLSAAARSWTADVHQTIVENTYNSSDFSPCRSITIFLEIELTESQCRSVHVCCWWRSSLPLVKVFSASSSTDCSAY